MQIARFMNFSDNCCCIMRSVFLLSLMFCLLVMQAGAVSLEDGVKIPLVADYISSDSERGVFLSALVAVEDVSRPSGQIAHRRERNQL